MTEKLNANRVGFALASVMGILSIVCTLLLVLIPGFTLNFFSNIFHGIDITQIAKTSVTFGEFLIGLIEVLIGSYLIGWVFAKIYNKLG